MAYSSSSRGGSSRGGSRGGGGGGGGGSSNAIAYVVAIVLVVGVVGLVLALSGKKETPKPVPVPAKKPDPIVQKPVVATEKPYPPLPQSKVDEAKKLVDSFELSASKAKTLIQESQKAHQSGDDSGWQSKLKEAGQLMAEINDKWDDFESSLPTGNGYDTDQVARHYLSKERGRVQELTKDLNRMKGEER